MSARKTHAKGGSKAREELHLDLIGAQAAVNTVIARLQERSGADRDMATVLFRLAVGPIARAIAETQS